ncbi:MAG TPA: enoyl-CoA hydratase-related protein [Acidimicrobiales bacterium]|jgi:enoyl-CoA hydratase|nr:enoyl-CoA hydratase-related protein [Acidimicrobiales bacterium]
MDQPVLLTERRGHLSILRMNRPEARNALNPELMAAMGRAILEAEEDPEIRCVVLTGNGDRAFCAGMDLRSFAEGGKAAPGSEDAVKAFGRFMGGSGTTVPIVGAANATAVAGGFELLLGCDVVVASEAAKFGLPEAKRGLMAVGGGVLLASRIPLAVALELNLTGDTIDAQRAYELGLVNRVVPADQVLDQAVALAEAIAANGPLALQGARLIVRAGAEDMGRARQLLAEWQPRIFRSADAKEGALAFVERREPVWRGE